MADYIVDHMNTTAVRSVFVLKMALNAVYGVLSFYTADIRPAWVIGGMFCLAAVLNAYPMVTLKPTKLIGVALVLSVGGCMFRAGAIGLSYLNHHSAIRQAGFAHMLLGVTSWLGLASFGIAATLGATDQLGRRDLARRSDRTRRV